MIKKYSTAMSYGDHPCATMEEDGDGDWVKYDEYIKLKNYCIALVDVFDGVMDLIEREALNSVSIEIAPDFYTIKDHINNVKKEIKEEF